MSGVRLCQSRLAFSYWRQNPQTMSTYREVCPSCTSKQSEANSVGLAKWQHAITGDQASSPFLCQPHGVTFICMLLRWLPNSSHQVFIPGRRKERAKGQKCEHWFFKDSRDGPPAPFSYILTARTLSQVHSKLQGRLGNIFIYLCPPLHIHA